MNKYYCIFEVNPSRKYFHLVCEFPNDYDSADDFCQSMNNFREKGSSYYYCVRCLTTKEFTHIDNYKIWF